jgi:hypothetical protein
VEYYRQNFIYAVKHGVNATVPVIVKLTDKTAQQYSFKDLQNRISEVQIEGRKRNCIMRTSLFVLGKGYY